MNRMSRVLLGVGCLVLLAISWYVAITAKSDNEKNTERQTALMEQAEMLVNDKIYVRAIPLLEEAASYETAHTIDVETRLKELYLLMFNKSGYRTKYLNLLEKQMSRSNASPEMFLEAANYYFSISRQNDAFVVLKNGIQKTGSAVLTERYEDKRYAYETSRAEYENVTAIHNGAIQVQREGLWGLARANGRLVIPCEYDKVSTFSDGRVIVKKDDEVFAVDANNDRIAKLHANSLDFGNFENDRVPVFFNGKWQSATSEFAPVGSEFEKMGMFNNGFCAAQQNSKWGVVNTDFTWVVPAEHDMVILDELGRCLAQSALFIQDGDSVTLLVNGERIGESYEDACPFSNEGYAAVKKNGKWGFIDTDGEVKINYQFDGALSFGQHLAAVKQGDLWGYISLQGTIVIDPVFTEAKSFSAGSAPVLTERGWQFITLLEYKE